jgi:hypothetical protein
MTQCWIRLAADGVPAFRECRYADKNTVAESDSQVPRRDGVGISSGKPAINTSRS